jgi:serine/threonine protein kinase
MTEPIRRRHAARRPLPHRARARRSNIATCVPRARFQLGVERAVRSRSRVSWPSPPSRTSSSDVRRASASIIKRRPALRARKDEKVVEGSITIFVTMELVPGGSLADFVRRRPVSQASALVAMRSVLRALQRARQESSGSQTLDVFVGKGGVPKLADFGSTHPRTGRQEARGALSAYLSPSNAGARDQQPSERRVRAGATLYSLVTGRTPRGSTTLRPRPAAESDRRARVRRDRRRPS